MKRATIEINQNGITAYPFTNPNEAHNPLIYFPSLRSDHGYPQVSSLDEAVKKLEGEGYTVIIQDDLFNTGIYQTFKHTGPQGNGWAPQMVIGMEEMHHIGRKHDLREVAFNRMSGDKSI